MTRAREPQRAATDLKISSAQFVRSAHAWRFIRAITSHTLRTYVTFTASSIQRISYSYRYRRARAHERLPVVARIFIADAFTTVLRTSDTHMYTRNNRYFFSIFIDARRITSATRLRCDHQILCEQVNSQLTV